MSLEAEQLMVMQILMAYGLSGEIGPHIPDLGALMQIKITHSEYIDQELSMLVAAAAAEATTARRICARNEAGACLAMARAALSGRRRCRCRMKWRRPPEAGLARGCGVRAERARAHGVRARSPGS